MKRSLFSLALAGLAVMAALPASAQINTSGITEFNRAVINLAEAYPCRVGTYADNSGITNEQIFTVRARRRTACRAPRPASCA